MAGTLGMPVDIKTAARSAFDRTAMAMDTLTCGVAGFGAYGVAPLGQYWASRSPGVPASGAGDLPSLPTQGQAAGAQEIRLTDAQYGAALELSYPSQFVDQLSVVVDGVGSRAAIRAVQDPRFVQAVQSGNRTLAGTLFHSAAAQEVRALPASALPPGWAIEAERVIQQGAGGSRADVLLRGSGLLTWRLADGV